MTEKVHRESGEELSIVFDGDFLTPAASRLQAAFYRSLALETRLPDWVRDMDGMSGRKYRDLINHLIHAAPSPRYLEVGSWAGSTACAAMFGNALDIVCIDNWSQFGGPKDRFLESVGRCQSDLIDFKLVEQDFREVQYDQLGSFEFYLFDGPHREQDQYDGIVCAVPALADEFSLVVDDWNWARVRQGTQRALADLDLKVVAKIEIRTTQDESYPSLDKQASDWHNGYALMVCRKPEAVV